VLDVIKDAFPDLIVSETVPVIDEALCEIKDGKLLVLSTPVTAGSAYMKGKILEHKDREIISLGMPNLIDFVEALDFDSEHLYHYFDEYLKKYLSGDIKAVSLGCTHYPFIRDILDSYLKDNGICAKIYEGSDITLKRLLKALDEKNLRSSNGTCEVEIFNSLGEKMVENSKKLLGI
ncbi:MAG: hypothetical protein MJ171_01815, partial [Clostridia bacterium]|nr:hypothetical protein [Clostridia bacterium]